MWGVKFLLFPPFSAIPPFFLLFRQNVLIVLLFTSVLGLCPLKCTFWAILGVDAFRWQGTWDNPSFRKEGQGILVCLIGLATSSWVTRRELSLNHTVVLRWHLVRLASLH